MGMVYTGGEFGGYEYVPDDVPNQGALSGALPAAQTDRQGFYNPSGEFVSTAPALSDFSQALTSSVQTPSATQTTAPLSIQTTTPPEIKTEEPMRVPTTPQPEVPTPPQEPNINYGGYSAKDIQNLLDWQATQYNPYTGQNIGESLKAQGIDRYSPEQIKYAVDTLDRAKGNATLVALNQGFPKEGVISSSSDPRTGAIMISRPEGTTDVFFPDGTKQTVKGLDASAVLQSYKGPTTGGYGVSPTNLGPWSDPNWRTTEALKRAAQEAERVRVANTPSPYVAGPGAATTTPGSATMDPTLKALLGNADPATVLRAINAGTLKPGALPSDIAQKLFPSGGAFPSETKKATAVTTPAVTTTGGTTTPTGTTTTPATTTPTQTTSGVQVADYQGNKFDTGSTMNLAKQVAGVFDTQNSTGGVFATKGEGVGFDYDIAKQIVGGDPTTGQQVALDISRYLQQKGVTDLGQIGVREVEVEVPEGGESAGSRLEKQKQFFNKDTGEIIADQSGLFGSTFTGKGATNYLLTERPDGSVGIKTAGYDTSDAGMIMPLLTAATMLFVPGLTQALSSTISSALPGAAVMGGAGAGAISLPTAANTFASNLLASGLINGVTSGVMAELGGGNFGDGFVKGALTGAAGSAAGSALNTYLPTDMNATIRTGLVNAGASAARAIATGGNVEMAIANGLMSGAASGALSTAGQAMGMDAKTAIATARTLAPIVLSLAKTGGLSEQTIMNAVMSAGATLIGNTKPGTVKETPPGKKAGGAITQDDLEFDAYAKAKRLGADDDEAMGLLRPAKRYEGGGEVWGEDGSDGTWLDWGGGGFDTPAIDISFETPAQADVSLANFDAAASNLAKSYNPSSDVERFVGDKEFAAEFIAEGGDPDDVAGFRNFMKGPSSSGEEDGANLDRVEVRGSPERSEDLSTGLIIPSDIDREYGNGEGVSIDLPSSLITPTEQDEDRRLDCAEGFHEENGLCVPDDDKKESTECPEGYLYNATSKQCEKIDTTKPGPSVKTPTTPGKTTTAAGKSTTTGRRTVPSVTGPSWLNLQALRSEMGSAKLQDPLENVMALAGRPTMVAPSGGGIDPFLQQILAQRTERPFYRYGQEPSIDAMLNPQRQYADGGYVAPLMAMGGMALPLLAKQGGLTQYGGREDFKDGKHVAGEGDGQSDDIPAWLADGEFVFPADVVSALGNGSTKAGTDKLYEMMHNIRAHARSSGPKDLPPPAKKSPLDYLSKKK